MAGPTGGSRAPGRPLVPGAGDPRRNAPNSNAVRGVTVPGAQRRGMPNASFGERPNSYTPGTSGIGTLGFPLSKEERRMDLVLRKDAFAGETHIVTGSAQGIGNRVAAVLAAHGARVALVDLDRG